MTRQFHCDVLVGIIRDINKDIRRVYKYHSEPAVAGTEANSLRSLTRSSTLIHCVLCLQRVCRENRARACGYESITVPFRPSVQSRVTAEKTDRFKIRLNSKENLSAFSETKISKIVNTWSKWYRLRQ